MASLITTPDSFEVGRLIGSYGFMNITSHKRTPTSEPSSYTTKTTYGPATNRSPPFKHFAGSTLIIDSNPIWRDGKILGQVPGASSISTPTVQQNDTMEKHNHEDPMQHEFTLGCITKPCARQFAPIRKSDQVDPMQQEYNLAFTAKPFTHISTVQTAGVFQHTAHINTLNVQDKTIQGFKTMNIHMEIWGD